MKGLKAIHVPIVITPLKQLLTGIGNVALGILSSDFSGAVIALRW
jgi:hypothetical protein